MTAPVIVHVASREEWAETVRAGGLRDEPFLHLCTDEQLPFVLKKHFNGRLDLVLVTIDPAGLDIRWESSEPGMDPFPHLYGWMPVLAAVDLQPILGGSISHDGADGSVMPVYSGMD